MSPRAAWRLEALGFEHVYDYVTGKADWLARGLPTEGERAGERRVGALVRQDAATCEPSEAVGEVHPRVEASPYGFALVTTPGGVLLGRLRRAPLEGDPEVRAEAAMELGPSTVRIDMALRKLAERLDEGGYETAVVTDPDGVLVGIARRDDLHREL
jgi:catechol 2,3-dioxygenase-like lactoylglutathione lyase family enzyme